MSLRLELAEEREERACRGVHGARVVDVLAPARGDVHPALALGREGGLGGGRWYLAEIAQEGDWLRMVRVTHRKETRDRAEAAAKVEALLEHEEHLEAESVTAQEAANDLGGTEERRAERHVGVNVGVEPALPLVRIVDARLDPREEVLNDAIAHRVAHEHHGCVVGLAHDLDLRLEMRKVAIAFLEFRQRKAPVVRRRLQRLAIVADVDQVANHVAKDVRWRLGERAMREVIDGTEAFDRSNADAWWIREAILGRTQMVQEHA